MLSEQRIEILRCILLQELDLKMTRDQLQDAGLAIIRFVATKHVRKECIHGEHRQDCNER